jgi:hypothetical protein
VQEVNNGDCDIDFSTVKGAYILKRSVVDIGSTKILKVSESSYDYQPPEGGYVFTLLNKPPPGITPGESFTLNISATNNEKEPRLNYHSIVMWRSERERFPDLSDGRVRVGLHEGKIIPASSVNVKMKVPQYSGKELILEIQIANDYGRFTWVKFVYEKR